MTVAPRFFSSGVKKFNKIIENVIHFLTKRPILKRSVFFLRVILFEMVLFYQKYRNLSEFISRQIMQNLQINVQQYMQYILKNAVAR